MPIEGFTHTTEVRYSKPQARIAANDSSSFGDVVQINRTRGFWSEVQRVYENCIWTSLPSSLRIAGNGVLKPRHFLGVRLAVRMMSWISSSDTLSMSI